MTKRKTLITVVFFVTICAGLTWRQFRANPRESLSESWNGDISSISGKEFRRQLDQNGMIEQRSFPTVFRWLGRSPSEEILPWLNRLDLRDKVLADGPHIETISSEGSRARHDLLIQSISAFRCKDLDLFVLRQKTYVTDPEWGTFALVQDKRATPNVAYFYRAKAGVFAEADTASCYRCHANGPRAIHPPRPDLLAGTDYLAEFNENVSSQEFIETAHANMSKGPELLVKECVLCHSRDGERSPLYTFHSQPIRDLVSRGLMPPDKVLPTSAALEIEVWLASGK